MRTWALAVGINEYPPASGQSVLWGAVADAADFADWALHANGGAVVPANLFFWTHHAPVRPTAALLAYLQAPSAWADPESVDVDFERGAPIDPARQGRAPKVNEIVLTALRAARRAKAEGGESRLYVFFAGHGVQTTTIDSAQSPQTCFMAGDFRPGPLTLGLLPCDDFRNGLLTLGFTQVIMFIDCCRAAISLTTAPPQLPMMRATPLSKRIYGVGRAVDFGEIAYEAPCDDPKRGAFSKVLIDGLRRHRDDASKILTLNALETYVETSIGEVVAPRVQYPQFEISPRFPKFKLLESAPIDPEVDLRVTFTIASAKVLLKDGKTQTVATFENVDAGEVVTVSAPAGGLYSLETPDQTRVYAFPHTGPETTDVNF